MPRLQQTRWSDFRAGLDTRESTFVDGDAPLRFREYENVIVGTNRRPRRRWPVKDLDVSISDEYQGDFLVNGRITTIKYQGDSGTITGGDAGMIDVLDWDRPPGVSVSSWELLDVAVLDGVPCAAIRHYYIGGGIVNGVEMRSVVYLHVWDKRYDDGDPTWVSDPYVPCNFLQGWSVGTLGGVPAVGNAFVQDYVPRLAAVGSRLAMTRPDGRTGLSKLGNPRSWNLWTQSDIEENGEVCCFLKASASTMTEVLGQFKYTDFVWDSGTRESHRFYSYVLEYWDATEEAWMRFNEVRTTDTLTDGDYRIDDDGTGLLQVELRDSAGSWDHHIVRFRALRKNHFSGTLGVHDEATAGVVANTQEAHWADKRGTPNAVYRWGDEMSWPYTLAGKDVHVSFRIPEDDTDYIFHLRLETVTNQELGGREIPLYRVPGATIYYPTNYVGTTGAPNSTWHLFNTSTGFSWYEPVTSFGAEWMTGLQRYERWLFPWKFKALSTGSNDFFIDPNPWLEPDPDWHEKRFLREIDMAGAASALVVGSGSTNDGQGQVLAICAIRNSLFLQYEGSTQMWSVPADANAVQHLDTSPFGCGARGYPEAVQFDAGLVLSPSVNGWRGWDVGGNDVLNLQDKNIGEAIDLSTWPALTPQGSAYWPHQGCYVSLGVHDGDDAGVAFRFSRESRIASWSRITFSTDQLPIWRNPSTPQIPNSPWQLTRANVFPLADRLYWRHGDRIKYFDASETVSLIDENETPGNGFSIAMRTHPLRLNPDIMKRAQYLEVVQNGSMTVEIGVAPALQSEIQSGPTIPGMTYTNRRVMLPYMFYSIDLRITSDTESLYELGEISLAWTPLKRLLGG